jgi:hypothetical protein
MTEGALKQPVHTTYKMPMYVNMYFLKINLDMFFMQFCMISLDEDDKIGRMGHDRIRPDKTGQNRTGQNRTGQADWREIKSIEWSNVVNRTVQTYISTVGSHVTKSSLL